MWMPPYRLARTTTNYRHNALQRAAINTVSLRINPASLCRVGHPADRQHTRCHAQVALMVVRQLRHLLIRPLDHLLQPLIDLIGLPEEALDVLHPLEVADCHTARVGQDVWHDRYATFGKDGVSLRRRRAVCPLDNQPRLHTPRVLASDLPLGGRRNQHLTGNLKRLGHAHRLRAGEANHRPRLRLMAHNRRNIQSALIEESTLAVADSHHTYALLRQVL